MQRWKNWSLLTFIYHNGWIRISILQSSRDKDFELNWTKTVDAYFFCSNSYNLNLVASRNRSIKLTERFLRLQHPMVQRVCIVRSWEGAILLEKFELIYILKVVKTGSFSYKIFLKQMSMRDKNPNETMEEIDFPGMF